MVYCYEGYHKEKIQDFEDDVNPALALIVDWIHRGGNNSACIDSFVQSLEHISRDDVADIIQKGRGTIFSYSKQWECFI